MSNSIQVRLPTDLLVKLNNAALSRRSVSQPVMSKARDEVVEQALREFLDKPLKPVSPTPWRP